MMTDRLVAVFCLGVVWLISLADCAGQDRLNRVIIDSIESARPTVPTDLLQAVNSLVNIGEFELANEYLGQVLATESTRDELAELLDHFGSAFFLKLALKAPLQPAIETYNRRVFDAAQAAATDEARLAVWTRQLADASPDVRLAALNRLRQAGPYGAAAILNELADSASPIDAAPLRAALLQLGPSARPVLVAALRNADHGTLRVQAIAALRGQNNRDIVPDMLRWCFADSQASAEQTACQQALASAWGKVPSVSDAREYLLREINALLRGEQPLDADLEGLSQLWFWGTHGLEQRVYPQAVAELIRATQLAGDLFTIDHETSEPRLLFAATQLGTAKIAGGIARPLSMESATLQAILSEFSSVELETVLAFALERELVPSTVATAELLGQMGTAGNLAYDATKSALAAALRDPDRRVQFAAAQAIMRLNPGHTFAGASDLMHVLTRFAASRGTRRVLIISPLRSEADVLAVTLPGLGFVGDIATNGRQALSHINRTADYELILLSGATSSPRWSELIQQLRHDYRSRKTPVCILIRGANAGLAHEIEDRYERTLAFPAPYDSDSMATLLNHILPARRDDQLSYAERHEYATAALGWLATIAEHRARYAFLEIENSATVILQALDQPGFFQPAAAAAGYLGTPAAQRTLLNAASDTGRTMTDREAALDALQTAIDRRGLLLTRPQLVAQYERYNQAVDRNDPQAELWGRILDEIERPSGASSR